MNEILNTLLGVFIFLIGISVITFVAIRTLRKPDAINQDLADQLLKSAEEKAKEDLSREKLKALQKTQAAQDQAAKGGSHESLKSWLDTHTKR